MTELLILIIFNSFLCLGFYQACLYIETTQQIVIGDEIKPVKSFNKGLLWFVPKYFNKYPWWLRKPLYDCLACMASIHSWPYWLVVDWNIKSLMFYPVYVLALSGFNFILDQITNKLSE